jgi:septin family protein
MIMANPQDRGTGRHRLNVMTVGQRSTGKATFLKSLVQNYTDENFTITKPVWRAEAPGDDIRVEKVRVVEVGRTPVAIGTDLVDLVMYDSLGFGDFINNQDAVASIRNYVLESHAHWRNLDVQVR